MNRETETPYDATPWIPASSSLRKLERAASECRGCDLYRNANGTVFGEGMRKSRIMIVGEQPGDREDLEGRPFVGPSGRLLDDALERAGLNRETVYLTNAVKHFKFERRGKRRIHKTPDRLEIEACRPWLEAERRSIRPAVVVAAGATAARAIFGPGFGLMKNRGRIIVTPWAERSIATIHPSAVLRARSPARSEYMDMLISDLALARKALESDGDSAR